MRSGYIKAAIIQMEEEWIAGVGGEHGWFGGGVRSEERSEWKV